MCRRAWDGRSPFLSSGWVSFLLSSGGSERLRSFPVPYAMWHVSSASVLHRYVASWALLFARGLKTFAFAPLVDTLMSQNQTCEKLNLTQEHHCSSNNRPLTESRMEFRPSAWWIRPWSHVFIDGVVGQGEVRPNAGLANVCGSVTVRISLAARRARRRRRCCLSITSVLEWKIRVCLSLQELDGKASKYHQVLMEVQLYLNKSF